MAANGAGNQAAVEMVVGAHVDDEHVLLLSTGVFFLPIKNTGSTMHNDLKRTVFHMAFTLFDCSIRPDIFIFKQLLTQE
jgi:hypothetical protein